MAEELDYFLAGPSDNDVAGSHDLYWIERVHYDDEADEKEEMIRSVTLLGNDGRRFTWWMCSVLKVNVTGIPGQAVQIVERYLASYLRCDDTVSSERLEQRRATLYKKLPFIVAVSVWLATKMNSASDRRLHAFIICLRLRQYAIKISVKDLTQLEREVYKRINFRFPIWSTVEKANLMAISVGYTGAMFKSVEQLMTIAEMLRDQIQQYVITIARSSSPSEGTTSTPIGLRNIRNGHFCAGVVLAVASVSEYRGPSADTVIEKLVKFTKSTPIYLKSIANAINFKYNLFRANPILPFHPSPPPKRRFEIVNDDIKRPRV